MEEIKQGFIPLQESETDQSGTEGVRSGSEPAEPLPSRMTREYSEFLHRFEDDNMERNIPADIPLPDDAGVSAEKSRSDVPNSCTDTDFSAKQYGSAVDENNPAEEIVDRGSFSL